MVKRIKLFECQINSSMDKKEILNLINKLKDVKIENKTKSIMITRGIPENGEMFLLDFKGNKFIEFEHSTTEYVDFRNMIISEEDSFTINRVQHNKKRW